MFFTIRHEITFPASAEETAREARRDQQIAEILRILRMVPNLIMTAKAEIKAEIAAEAEQLRAGLAAEVARQLAEALKDKGLSAADIEEIKADIAGIFTPASDPEPGTSNVRFGFVSIGPVESFSLTGTLSSTDQEQVEALRGVMRKAVDAGKAKTPGGGELVNSNLFFSVDGASEISENFTDLAQKAAADVATLEALLELARAQVAELGG